MNVDLRDPEVILSSPLPVVALAVLRRVSGAAMPSRQNFLAEAAYVYSIAQDAPVIRALAEAWDFLERHGFVSRHLDERTYFVTRRGRDVLAGALTLPDEPHAGPPLR
jgi:hypothetical protein